LEADGPGWAASKELTLCLFRSPRAIFVYREKPVSAFMGNVDSSCGRVSPPKLGDALDEAPEKRLYFKPPLAESVSGILVKVLCSERQAWRKATHESEHDT